MNNPNELDPAEVHFLKQIATKKAAQLAEFAVAQGLVSKGNQKLLLSIIAGLLAVVGGMAGNEALKPPELVAAREAIRDARDYVLTFAPAGGEKQRAEILRKLNEQLGE